MHKARLEKLRREMEKQNLEAFLITNSTNRRYMTGFTGTSGYVLVTADKAALFTDFRYMEQAASQAKEYEVVLHAPKPMETVKEWLKRSGVQRLGFEENDVTYGDYLDYSKELDGIRLEPAGKLVERLRALKDDEELRIMQEAANLADAAFRAVLDKLKPGVREADIAFELEAFMRRNGASGPSFDTIVASGERSALPHGVAGDRILQPGDFVTLDFGAYFRGYCSDLTRTVVLGKASAKQKEIYEIVLEAQMHALSRLQPGMTGKEGDALARDIIAKYGYAAQFGHGTGHGLGMEIHESPRLSLQSETVLEPGMVVTVEPGIYIPGFGGVRIEDDVVITGDGVHILTHSTKRLLIID